MPKLAAAGWPSLPLQVHPMCLGTYRATQLVVGCPSHTLVAGNPFHVLLAAPPFHTLLVSPPSHMQIHLMGLGPAAEFLARVIEPPSRRAIEAALAALREVRCFGDEPWSYCRSAFCLASNSSSTEVARPPLWVSALLSIGHHLLPFPPFENRWAPWKARRRPSPLSAVTWPPCQSTPGWGSCWC